MIKSNPIKKDYYDTEDSSCLVDNQFKTVQIVVTFLKIGDIDMINEKYQAEVFIEAKWIENDFIERYDPKRHWNPKLSIEKYLLTF